MSADDNPTPADNTGDAAPVSDSDVANARRFVERCGRAVRFTPESGWYVWDGRRWADDGGAIEVQELAKGTAVAISQEVEAAPNRDTMLRHAKRSQSSAGVSAMIRLARSERGVAAKFAMFDTNPWLLNVANGTLDLRNGALLPHCPDDHITKLVPITYDPQATCPLWDSFVRQVTGNSEELYGYLQRLVGYLLTGTTHEQVLHFLYGLGANGKSVFCEIVRDLLGEYALIASPEMLMARRHAGVSNDIARLRGVRAALINETAQGAHFDEAKLKDLTGCDSLTGRFLYHENFDFPPTHKILMRGNHKPTIRGTDEGIWRRLRMLPFSVSIPREQQDRQLLEKLKAQLPGILLWAVRGCLEWQQNGLNPPAVVVEAVQEYRQESDTVGRFIEECCEIRKLAQVKSSVLYAAYREFCERSGERYLPSKDFPAEMERRGYLRKRGTGGTRLLLGIELMHEHSWSNGLD